MVSNFSRNEHIRGGSLILVKQDIESTDIPAITELSMECHIEMCAVGIKLLNKKIINILAYRPPSGDIDLFITCLSQALDIASSKSNFIILTGDFNINFNEKCTSTKLLKDLFSCYELTITCSNEDTRIFTYRDGHTSSTCIDYMATNMPANMFDCQLIDPNIADHLSHFLCINSSATHEIRGNQVENCKVLKKRNITSNNIAHLNVSLSKVDWFYLIYFNVNDGFLSFIETIVWYFNECCPVKYREKKCTSSNKANDKKWLTGELIKEGTEIKNMFWLMKTLDCHQLKNEYQIKKKEYKKKIKITKQTYFKNKINNSSNKTKETWNIINSRLGKSNKNNKNIILKYESEYVSDPYEVSELFASHFSSIAENKIKEHFGQNIAIPGITTIKENTSEFCIEPVTEKEIMDITNTLKNEFSCGTDDISLFVLKNIHINIIGPLVYLINQSFCQGCFPDILKIARVIPLFKKGCSEDIDNYRQISVLSTISKIIEKAFYVRLIDYVEKNKILTPSQHGFRSGRSIETASCHLLNYVHSCLDDGKYVLSMFFDLSKAFDTVHSERLLTKLFDLGIRDTALRWIQTYMEGRSLTVSYNNTMSSIHNVKLGVPQGSVLGPLLFMLYVNDLPDYIKSAGHVTMFADDTTISVSALSSDDIQLYAENVVNLLMAWCDSNRLILNTNKTMIINFHIRRPLPINFKIFDIELGEETKYLGTYLDSKLSWDKHIDDICNKLNKAYFGILQLKDTLDESGLLSIYYALAYSHISLNIISWGYGRERGRVFILQKRLIRLISNLRYNESCRTAFREKKILTLPCIYIFKCLMYTKNNLNLFVQVANTHPYKTRHGKLLSIPSHRTTSFKHSSWYNCVNLYNALPESVREINCPKLFKNKVKTILLEGAFYSADEYISGFP